MDEKEKITQCYRDMYRGMIEKDRILLSSLLDKTFVLAHMTGMRQGREAFIRAVEDGTLNYYWAEHQTIDVNLYEDRAELIGRSLVNAAVFGSGRHTWRLQLKVELTKRSGEWRITGAQALTY